jgi:Asp-tRNA(Asn)/Glu-tRNA(Gln) amidotransferase C subunit
MEGAMTEDRVAPTPETVAALARAVGLPIDRDRLPDVAAVLAELLALEAQLENLDLTGVGPDLEPESWPDGAR